MGDDQMTTFKPRVERYFFAMSRDANNIKKPTN